MTKTNVGQKTLQTSEYTDDFLISYLHGNARTNKSSKHTYTLTRWQRRSVAIEEIYLFARFASQAFCRSAIIAHIIAVYRLTGELDK